MSVVIVIGRSVALRSCGIGHFTCQGGNRSGVVQGLGGRPNPAINGQLKTGHFE
jgi:hypothetical protein